jgi:Tol biopolymer transport system component
LTDYVSYSPAASPDGKFIALLAGTDPNRPTRLALISVDGGQPIKTFDLAAGGNGPEVRWSPDARSVIYSSSNLSGFVIWSQPIDGGKPVQLFAANDNVIFSFVPSRNGKEIIAAYGPQFDDIVLIKDFK